MKVSIVVDGKTYRGEYRHNPGALPELRIGQWNWRGSSLGPVNWLTTPDRTDRDYWRGLIRDNIARDGLVHSKPSPGEAGRTEERVS